MPRHKAIAQYMCTLGVDLFSVCKQNFQPIWYRRYPIFCSHQNYLKHYSKMSMIDTALVHTLLLINTHEFFIGFICYDDACHLKKFARHPARATLTEQSKQLASVEMVVDRMHMKGHVDPWCKEHCDAAKIPELSKV